MDIREAIAAFLTTQPSLSAVGGRVYPQIRPQGSGLPAIVYRVVKGEDGSAIDGDSRERVYTFELVVWAATLLAAVGIGTALKTLLHGTGRYELHASFPRINESHKVGEYDGDRVTDSFADAGEYPITYLFEFHWIASP